MLAVCIVIIFISVKGKKYGFMIWVIAGICLGMLFSFLLRTGLHATKGSFNEALSLPYQQIACAYKDHEQSLTTEDKMKIMTIIPDVEKYNPYIADAIKSTSSGDSNMYEFVELYFKFAIKYPRSYIKAFCKLNAGYLCLVDTTFSEIYGTSNRQGIFLSDTKAGFGVEHISLFPWLENLYEELYTSNKYLYILGLNLFCSPALYFWTVFAMLGYAFIRQKSIAIVLFVFVCMLIATILAGPCCLIRYALPYMVCIPPLMSIVFVN